MVADCDAVTRARVLERECNGDPALLALVEQMLDADEHAHPILDQPLAPADPAALKSGDTIGSYRIVRLIGVGGMGTVYQAEPADASGLFVAIKILHWYSHEISLRFKQEQTILSSLRHPNIARLLESGTLNSHTPYFVMEYVEGRPIDSYCDGKRLADRIGLFRQVCGAVAYLHRHLVVHRDLKPGNVLVTPDGTVKLLDFGIAKLLAAPDGLVSPLKTIAGLMTPDYASPEQIRGNATSTLSDVYSLGVLLYELLTGQRPFTGPASEVHETLRRICEDEPRKPSIVSANKRLRGELDNIVLKALRKEPERRYATVEQLDEDLRRYLAGEPVLAQGDSLGYRVRKFVTRYKGAVAAGLVMIALLAGGIVGTSIEANKAREQQLRAESQAAEAEKQRTLAEEHAHEAERRLAELQKLAKGVVRNYDAGREGAKDVRESLLALRGEKGLDPGLRDDLARLENAKPVIVTPGEAMNGWSAAESGTGEYRIGQDNDVAHDGKPSIVIQSTKSSPSGAGLVYQVVDAQRFRGKRVRLSGYLKSEVLVRSAALSFFTSYESGLARITGTTPWKKYELVSDVPAVAEKIRVVLTLEGPGTLWAADFRLEPVGMSVPLTIHHPENLDFTQR